MQPFITLQSLNFEIILQKLINVYTLIRACRWEKFLWKNKHVYMFIREGRVGCLNHNKNFWRDFQEISFVFQNFYDKLEFHNINE